MKKFTVMGIVLFIALAVCSVYSFAESFDGFRGLKWGSSPAKGMIKVWRPSGDETEYRRPSDALQIGTGELSVELAAIEYHYNKNRLHTVWLKPAFRSRVDYALLSRELSLHFGDPVEEEKVDDGVLVITKSYDQDPFTVAFLKFEVHSSRIFCLLSSKRMLDIMRDEKLRARQKKIGKKNTGF